MDIIDKLILSSASKQKLSSFIEGNVSELYDYLLTQNYSDLSESKSRIDGYVSQYFGVLQKLNFSIKSTEIFILLLLDMTERFGLLFSFERLYSLLVSNKCGINSRLEASALYLTRIDNISDYYARLDKILSKLLYSYKFEEDVEDRVLETVVNYYAQVVHNFGYQNLSGVLSIRDKLHSRSMDDEYFFLRNDLIDAVLKIKITHNVTTYNKIHEVLDHYLKRGNRYPTPKISKCLIEENTNYSMLLENVSTNFYSIQRVSIDLHQKIHDQSVHDSLLRGVKVLTEEKQLYAYLKSYGNMHYKKMISSLEFLPIELFNEDFEIIDWGCGQGLATMAFFDHLNKADSTDAALHNVTLVEPSELAIKRASLHIKKYKEDTDVITINKDLDSLISGDFTNNRDRIKLHLFSNILDIDLFSLTNLINLINTTFDGDNYFVCSSPFINDLKTFRLESFLKSFSKNENFRQIKSIDNRKGEWAGTTWSRVIRIFKAHL